MVGGKRTGIGIHRKSTNIGLIITLSRPYQFTGFSELGYNDTLDLTAITSQEDTI